MAERRSFYFFYATYVKYLLLENLTFKRIEPHHAKTCFAICKHQRHRSACASAQSDQRLCCLLPGQYTTSTCYIQKFKTLASFWSWAARFESELVRNPEDWFSGDEAQFIQYSYQFPALGNPFLYFSHCLELYSCWLWTLYQEIIKILKSLCLTTFNCWTQIFYLNALNSAFIRWSHMNCIMTKPTKWVCAQQRLRSAWASAQSDQSLCCALSG